MLLCITIVMFTLANHYGDGVFVGKFAPEVAIGVTGSGVGVGNALSN